jgi:rifampicin phosphotransferase
MIPTTTNPRLEPGLGDAPGCVLLEAIGNAPVGGKAAGLARLRSLGLSVPPAFVVIHARRGRMPPDLEAIRARVCGTHAVAVRSSALGEDSAAASFAGQYTTILDVAPSEPVAPAIERCLASLEGARAETYRRIRDGGSGAVMSVVVQQMVDARAAGVVFTADPISGRRDRLIVDAVRGRGDALVSGLARPDHYVLRASGELDASELTGAEPILAPSELAALASDALRAARAVGSPLDLEWAIDAQGRVHWLQARPITALPADPNELDALQRPTDVYTSCNIGECMPGAVTPLSLSTVWHANDYSIQLMQVRSGARDRVRPGLHTSRAYFNHMFLNLTAIGRSSSHVLGSNDEALALAICGRVVPELDTGPKAPVLTRLWNAQRYLRYLGSGKRHEARLTALTAALAFPAEQDAAASYRVIDAELPKLYQAFDHHMTSSAGAGALEPALMGVLARGKPPTEEHHARLAQWLAAASEQDVETAEVPSGVERIVAALATLPRAQEHFAMAAPSIALEWLRRDPQTAAARELELFLARHGHQRVRAFELRDKEWAADPLPLVQSLQASLRARSVTRDRAQARPTAASKLDVPRNLRWLVRLTQSAVRRRERTKSLLLKVVTRFKSAYRRLGEQCVAEGKLPDADAVFFLTHAELADLCGGSSHTGDLAPRAVARREIYGYQAKLSFPDVFSHSPEPLRPEGPPAATSKVLRGKPVSRGTVTGRARVALSLDDAACLQPGEILISPVTDVGWSPYFALIGGLATDVGSSVSHGAVVAREYGLPAVVDLRTATTLFRTGDRVVLDADHGVLRLADDVS